MRKLKGTEDYDYPTALPSHGTASNTQNLKYFVLDPPLHENRRENQMLITTIHPVSTISTPGSLIGTRSLPYTSQESMAMLSNGYNQRSSQELIASPSPPQRLNRIPPPIPLVKNNPLNTDSYEEHGKTKYWTASGKRLGKKKPYHGPKKAQRAESKRIKMTIRPKMEEKIRVTKIPFIIKV